MTQTMPFIAMAATMPGLAFMLGAGLMAAGFLAVIAGFFMAMMNTAQRFEQSSLVFVLGIVALVVGAWLMRLTP